MRRSRRYTASVDDKSRVRFPVELARTLEWLSGEEVGVLFLLLEPGRYRLIPLSAGETDAELRRLRTAIQRLEERPAQDDLLDFESAALALLPSRLVEGVASSRGPGWRVTLPTEAVAFGFFSGEERNVLLQLTDGLLEIFLPTAVRRAHAVPLSGLLGELE